MLPHFFDIGGKKMCLDKPVEILIISEDNSDETGSWGAAY
jgi:hypothetical protein